MRKIFFSAIIILWTTVLLAAYYVVQKPDFLQITSGLGNLILTLLIPAWLFFLSAGIGHLLLPKTMPVERISIGTSLGLGIFGLTGFGMGMLSLARPVILLVILFTVTTFLFWKRIFRAVWSDLQEIARSMATGSNELAKYVSAGLSINICLSLLLGLAPPAEDFDALFYHLTVPAIWLRQGSAVDFIPSPHYWFPKIVEGIYVWALTFGADSATHLIHLLWLVLTGLLLWHWANRVFGSRIAWFSLLILLSMPSLPYLAAWAYTDYALVFAALATLYALWKQSLASDTAWLVIAGLMAGLAVSVKYTGVIVPIAGVLIILIKGRSLRSCLVFGMTCTLAALPWYARNWISTGNPIYPFIFGGSGWDSFYEQIYAAPGSGIGWNLSSLISLPVTATLGLKDANYFDGRIGPFFLILMPFAAIALWNMRDASVEHKNNLQLITAFTVIGGMFWTIGVIESAHLFQNRLLLPVLIPLTIPLTLGLDSLERLDSPRLKISFIIRFLLVLSVAINTLNLGLQIIARNPLAATLGMVARDDYIARRQPGYARILELAESTPPDAVILLLFEPRSYGIPRTVQPDELNIRFLHDLWKYHTVEAVIDSWKKQGFTHILLSHSGASFIMEAETASSLEKEALVKLEETLISLRTSSDGSFTLYEITR